MVIGVDEVDMERKPAYSKHDDHESKHLHNLLLILLALGGALALSLLAWGFTVPKIATHSDIAHRHTAKW